MRAAWLVPAVAVALLGCAACSTGKDDPAVAARVAELQAQAATLYEQGDLRGALREAVRALTVDPSASELCDGISRIYTEMGRDDEAVEFFALAAEKLPDKVTPRVLQGHHEYLLGHWDLALAAFDEAARLDPDNPVPPRRCGEIYHAQGRFEEALSMFERAFELDRSDVETAVRLVRSQRITGRYETAMQTVEAALAENPEGAGLHHAKAQLLVREQRLEEAERSLRRALELDPRHREAHYDLARLLHRAGRDAEAAEHERRAARLASFERGRDALGRELVARPTDPSVPLAFAELELTEDNFAEALGWFRRARSRGAQGPRLAGGTAEALFGMGELERGEAALRSITATDGHSDLAMATRLIAEGRPAPAAAFLERAVATGPEEREYLYRVADLLAEAGLPEQASAIAARAAAAPGVVEAMGGTHHSD